MLRAAWARLVALWAGWRGPAVLPAAAPCWRPGSQAFCATSTRWYDSTNAIHMLGPRLGDVLVIDRVVTACGGRTFLAFTRFPGVAFSADFFRPVGPRHPAATCTVETTDAP